jgi:hypothetical protein
MPAPASAWARAGFAITATATGTRSSRRPARATTALNASSSVTAASESQPATAPSMTERSSAEPRIVRPASTAASRLIRVGLSSRTRTS